MKNYCIALGSMLLALAVAGCSGGKSAGGSGAGPGEIEVAAFQGGYGIDFYEKLANEFGEKNGLKFMVWGNPRVWEQLRTRFIDGSPPDLCFPGWGMDHWALAEDGQLEDLGPELDKAPYEGEGTWRDTFDPAILKLGELEGKQYVLPYYVMVLGWWYDAGVFEKNGWTPPKTWSELLTLCEKIKATGLAPITFQGKYPYYMLHGMLLPWAVSVGGIEAVNAAQNMEPGAWKAPAFVQAARMIDELNKKGYLQQGAVAMSHTEAQQEFIQGRAAMVPCGTWLESEMKNVMPEGVNLRFFLPPIIAGGKGDPTALLIGIEPWMVPTQAKHKREAIELFRYMTSLENAKRFVKEKSTLMAITGSDQVELPESLKAPAAALKASKTLWAVQFKDWYPAFQTEAENALTAMLNGDLTPEGFCDRVEAAAQKLRDDGVKLHKLP